MAKKKYKLPLEVGFAALCDHIKAIRKTADASGSAVSALAEAVGETVEEIESILNEKQDIHVPVSFTIPTTGWGTDTSVADFPNYYDVAVSGLLETDVVAVTTAPGSAVAARAADFTTVQSYAGKFRLRCKAIPAKAIVATYQITDATVNSDDLSVDTPTA